MQNLPDPRQIWNEDINKPINKNRILMGLSKVLLLLTIVTSGMYLSGVTDNLVSSDQVVINDLKKTNTMTVKSPEEYAAQEEARKAADGEFYVPSPNEPIQRIEMFDAPRGLYLSTDIAFTEFSEQNIEDYADYVRNLYSGNSPDSSKISNITPLERALALTKVSEINTLIIDMKTEDGILNYNSNIALSEKIGSEKANSDNSKINRLLDYTIKNKIYTVARIMTFKDPLLALKSKEHSMLLKDSSQHKDENGIAWVNPFDKYVWKYNVAVAKEVSLMPFNEILFDYVRFPDNSENYNDAVEFNNKDNLRKDDAIREFLNFARKELELYGVKTSASVTGTTVGSFEDYPEDIGQTYRKVADSVDRISPMMYPSDFGKGWFDFDNPDAYPYEVLSKGLILAQQKSAMTNNKHEITPWVQAFTADWIKDHIKYTPATIIKELQAAQAVGIESYYLWNASGYYDPLIFQYNRKTRAETPGRDNLGKSVNDVLEAYFEAVNEDNWQLVFILLKNDSKPYSYDEFEKKMKEDNLKFTDISYDKNSSEGNIEVSLSYSIKGNTVNNTKLTFEVVKERGVYKVGLPKLSFNQ